MAGKLSDIHPAIDEKYFYLEVGITLKTAADVCDVTHKTAKRWRDNNAWPTWARRLVTLYAGYLAQDNWHGWKIHAADGKLYAPGLRDGFTPGEIQSLPYLRQRCTLLEQINAAPAQYFLDI